MISHMMWSSFVISYHCRQYTGSARYVGFKRSMLTCDLKIDSWMIDS